MHALFTVFRKEFLENLRDRRTVVSALLFGPLFGPLLFGAMVSRMLEQSAIEPDEPLQITISGGERAPNLDALPRIPRREAHRCGPVRRRCARRSAQRREHRGPDRARGVRRAIRRGETRAAAAGGRQLGFADTQERRACAHAARRLRQRYRATAPAGPGCQSAARGAGGGQRDRRDDARRPCRGGAGVHDLFRALCGADGGAVPGHRFDRGRARTGVAGSPAQPAGGACIPGRRQDSRDLRLHVAVARHQSGGIRRRVSLRAARAARHERQSRHGNRAHLLRHLPSVRASWEPP